MNPARDVLVTGATGYIGRALVVRLVERGHRVRALVRDRERARLPSAVELTIGDALRVESLAAALRKGDTLVQLVGVPKPAPWKARAFRAVDRTSALAAVAAARDVGVAHFVYLSVAQPAPVMRAYVAVRAECEAAIRASGLRATCVRPWYVIGPGHTWPLVFVPLYTLAELLPATRPAAERLGLVRLDSLVAALVQAIEDPPLAVRVLETHAIRAARLTRAAPGSAPA